MKVSKVLMAALFALCVAAMASASSAAAAEECYKVVAGTGLWENNTCTTATAKGNFELFTFLLALWLRNGVEVTTQLPTETTGELTLEDQKTLVGKAVVLCSGILDGWVGPNSLGWVSEVLNLTKEAISTTVLSGLPLECTAVSGCETNTTPLVWAANLGWETEVELYESVTLGTGFGVLILPHPGATGNPGWYVECLVLGTVVDDTCTAAVGGSGLSLEGTTLLGVFSEELSLKLTGKLANCTQGGEGAGNLTTDTGNGTIILVEGGELTASSETLVS